jgi:hypothetical protein
MALTTDRGSSTDNCLTCSYSKYYIWSGQFTSTVNDSQASVNTNTQGIARDGSDVDIFTLSTSQGSDKHYKLSGQFTSTVKASLNVGTTFGETEPRANQPDGKGNCTLTGLTLDRLFFLSGQFSTTVKDSLNVGSIWSAGQPEECNIDAVGDTLFAAATPDDLYHVSGHFTTTLKSSISVGHINDIPTGVSWAGYDTLWCGAGTGISDPKCYRNSGYLTSTLHDSLAHGGTGGPRGIVTQNYAAQMASRLTTAESITAVDAYLKNRLTKTFAVNARVMDRHTKTFAIDGNVNGIEKSFTCDARVMDRGSRSFTVDADLIILPGNPAGNRPGDYDPDLGSPDYHNYIVVLGHKVVYFGEF